MPRYFTLIVSILFLVAAVPSIWSQGSVGTLNGTVFDSDGGSSRLPP
jgi:hypothetical protein